MKNNRLFIRTVMAFIGLMILGVGVAFTIQSGLGVDPASTLELGISQQTGISYGTIAALYNIILLGIVFFVDRKYINISSILAIFVIGYTVEIVNVLFLNQFDIANNTFFIRLLSCVLGSIIISIGITIYTFQQLGAAATDCISEIITTRVSLSYGTVRIISDVTLVFLGWLTGGIVGVGTLVTAFAVGPIVQFSRNILNPILGKITGGEFITKAYNEEPTAEHIMF